MRLNAAKKAAKNLERFTFTMQNYVHESTLGNELKKRLEIDRVLGFSCNVYEKKDIFVSHINMIRKYENMIFFSGCPSSPPATSACQTPPSPSQPSRKPPWTW